MGRHEMEASEHRMVSRASSEGSSRKAISPDELKELPPVPTSQFCGMKGPYPDPNWDSVMDREIL